MNFESLYKRLEQACTRLESAHLDKRPLWPQVESLIALYRKIDGLPTIPPTRNWAMSPDILVLIAELIERLRPSNIVECGAGTSTITMALIARKEAANIRIVSIEDSAAIAASVNAELAARNLSSIAAVYHAPLVKRAYEGWHEPFLWYDLANVPIPPTINLLVVDGPHGKTGPYARYPAGPELFSRLDQGATVVLDDAARQHEGELPLYWQQQYPALRWHFARVEKGAAVLTLATD